MRACTLVAMLVSALLLVTACGGDDDVGAEATSTAVTSTDAAPTATDVARATETATPAMSGALDALLELASGFAQVATWGGAPGEVRFEAPNGMTVDAEGLVYVTDFQGGHVRRFTPDGELLLEAGGRGAAPGQLANPIGVAVDAEGVIYVSESGTSRVSRFAPDGAFLSAWGGSGSELGQFHSAMGIAVSEAYEVFVADFGNHRVQVFDRAGVFLRAWGEFGAEPGQFNNPIGLQIGPEGNVWVVDSANERVQVFTQAGELVRVFDEVGPGPQIVSINAVGEFYVSSPWAEGRVRRFSAGGELIGYVGFSVTGEERARMTNEEKARAAELSMLSGPHGTATDPSGAVYVADTANGIVRKFVPATQ